jgi:hypothetical protein
VLTVELNLLPTRMTVLLLLSMAKSTTTESFEKR